MSSKHVHEVLDPSRFQSNISYQHYFFGWQLKHAKRIPTVDCSNRAIRFFIRSIRSIRISEIVRASPRCN